MLNTIKMISVPMLALALFACDSGDDTGSKDKSGDEGSAEAAEAADDEAATPAEESGGADEDEGEETAAGGSEETAGEAPDPLSCDYNPDESSCLQCIRGDCCEPWLGCVNDEGCLCAATCVIEEGKEVSECLGICQTDPSSSSVQNMIICMSGVCGADCTL